MMGPNKILTVSYGTFSCTLEGFDDPFSTMRSIAEYFRDLAAEDRYFGAEPPTPDAEMLHRIAEREIQKRVEARLQPDGVVLRQVEGAPAVAAEPAAEPQDAAPDAAAKEAVAPAEVIAEDSADDDADDATGADAAARRPEVSGSAGESVAAKLARIRAAAAAKLDDHAGPSVDQEIEEVFTAAPISAAFADVAPPDVAPPDVAPETEAEAVAGQEAAPAPADAVEAVTDDAAADDAAADDGIPEIPVTFETGPDEPQEEAASEAAPAAPAVDMPAMQEAPAGDDPTARADGGEAGPAATRPAEDGDDGEDWSNAPVAAPDAPAIARVVKMRREDFEAAVQDGSLTEARPEPGPSDGAAAQAATPEETADEAAGEEDEPESTLSPEDEAELLATLQAVQRKAEAEARAEKEGRRLLENQDIEESAESVSRLLDVTNSEMQESAGTRRRSAIAHLKRAVAATRADRRLSRQREEKEAQEMNRYRQDLAKVVRPRRPSDGIRPRERRVAPLVLVSEQRVDTGPSAAAPSPRAEAESVRPRRITSGNLALSDDAAMQDDGRQDNIFVEPESFARFAEEMGAHDLPDLLEAAAAYTAFVEGREHFSRPQIMNAVAALDAEKSYSREETLRSFGLLLRRGRIKKVRRGQFTISDDTRFKPVRQAAGK